jgi:C_GCAxxG_C_C family probable redox protein
MPANKETIERVRAKAFNNDKYSGCSQAVLGALQEEFGIGNLESFKSATVLSGGGARRGETCGALIGALMALGLVIGREKMEDTPTYNKAMDLSQDLVEGFKAELQKQFGFKKRLESTLCRDIQEGIYGRSFNLADEKERQAFYDAGGHTERGCLTTCAIAAELAAQKLLQLKKLKL